MIIRLTAWHHDWVDEHLEHFLRLPNWTIGTSEISFDDICLINKIIISTKWRRRHWFDIFTYFRWLRCCPKTLRKLFGLHTPCSIQSSGPIRWRFIRFNLFIHYSRPVNRTRTVSWIQIGHFKQRLHFSTSSFRFQLNGIKIDLIRCNMQCTCINCWTKRPAFRITRCQSIGRC